MYISSCYDVHIICLDRYYLIVGDEPFSDNIHRAERLDHTISSYCVSGLTLQHTRNYYSTITAVNGGHKERNVSAVSNGGQFNICTLI